MRPFVFFILLFLCIKTVLAQWYPQSSFTDKDLDDIFFLDNNYGWVTGLLIQDSLLLKTTDGGITWESYVTMPLQKLFFVNPNTGYALEKGMAPDCYKTTDGGMNWELIFEGVVSDYGFLNADTGFLLERTNSILYKTYDGGMSWEILDSLSQYSCDGNARQLSFVNENIAYVSFWYVHPGGSGQWGCLLKTMDGGQSWSVPDSIAPANYSLEFYNEYRGIAGAYYMNPFPTPSFYAFYKTIDGSSSWDIYYSGDPGNYVNHHSIFNLGWVIDGMNIKNTNDNGASWEVQHIANNTLRDVFFTDSIHGWAVGDNGTILYTDNGGGTVGIDHRSIPVKKHDIKVYPNPADKHTCLELYCYERSMINLSVYNMAGVLIKQMFHGIKEPGQYQISLDLSKLDNGLYLIMLNSESGTKVKKLIKL